jgi:hypothetical protein
MTRHHDQDTDLNRPHARTRHDDQRVTDAGHEDRRHPEPGPGTGRQDDPDPDRAGADREGIIPQDRAREYTARWEALKGGFVDEPRQAVARADQLVGELLDELQEQFRRHRHSFEQSLTADQASTEDLRLALRRYRNFFDRLLSA